MISDFATLFCFNLFTRVLRAEWLVICFDVSNGYFDMTFFHDVAYSMDTHWRFFKPNSAWWIIDNSQVKTTWCLQFNIISGFKYFWYLNWIFFTKSTLPGLCDPLGKSCVGEPIVFFKSEIFDFHVVILLSYPETKMKCKESPKSIDKCHRRVIAKLTRLP